MTFNEMQQTLRDRGVPDGMYLRGELGMGERYGIEFSENHWVIYYSERGKKRIRFQYMDEAAACEKFVEIMTDVLKRTPARPTARSGS